MRNLFKKRGLPDSTIHAGNPQHHQNNDSTVIQVSSSASPLAHSSSDMVSEPVIPSGYPYNTSYSHGDPPPPTAHPYYAAQPDGVSTGPVYEFNTGENINKKGQQTGGDIKVGNTVAGSSAGISFPQNGRYVFNTGKNHNEGELQVNGSVEFGNVFSDSH